MSRGERPPTQQRYERELRLGSVLPFTKEPENLWLFRQLGLEPHERAVYSLIGLSNAVYMQEYANELTECRVPKGCVETGIRSWIQNDGQPEEPLKHVGVVIVAPNCKAFLMMRKNLLQQNPVCCGKLSLFASPIHIHERPRSAACRAIIREAFAPTYFQTDGLHVAEVVASEPLRRVQWPEMYELSSYAVFLKDWSSWHRLFEELVENGLAESSLATFTRDEFQTVLLPQELAIPGKHFLSSHHRVIQHILNAYDRTLRTRPHL